MMEDRNEKLLALLALLLSRDEIEPASIYSYMKKLGAGFQAEFDLDGIIDELEKDKSAESANIFTLLNHVRRRQALKYTREKNEGKTPDLKNYPLLSGIPWNIGFGWHDRTPPPDYETLALCVRISSFISSGKPEYSKTRENIESRITVSFRDSVKEFDSVISAVMEMFAAGNQNAGGDIADFIGEAQKKINEMHEKPEAIVSSGNIPAAGDFPDKEILEALFTAVAAAGDRKIRNRFADAICTFPGKAASEFIIKLLEDPRTKYRTEAISILRFTEKTYSGADWRNYYSIVLKEHLDRLRSVERAACLFAPEILLLWGRKHSIKSLGGLEKICSDRMNLSESLLEKAKELIDKDEASLLNDIALKLNIKTEPLELTQKAVVQEVQPAKPEEKPVPEEKKPVVPPPPSLWETRIQPFFLENWYMIAGILMMVAGSSLLAYYTWDKHWILRYTIVPVIFGLFTAILAWAGTKLEKMDKSLSSMSAMLRGAAISLLPVNFMAVALLSGDPAVSPKALAVPLMALVYLVLGGWGLFRWCGSVHSKLGIALGLPLLSLNFLVALGPIAKSLGIAPDEASMREVLAAGFYAGFAILMVSSIRFSTAVLTPELAKEKKVPWFFGVMLTVTFLQVFAWEHGFLKILPQVYTYSPLLILAGWLVLFAERKALAMTAESALHGAESFIGFALVILGLLMGNADPWFRVICFLLSGGVWLQQALTRRHELHSWIALTLLFLGAVSVGLLPDFDPKWRPAIGIIVAVFYGAVAVSITRPAFAVLRSACLGMQATILPLTAIVAVLSQWYMASDPRLTAIYILSIAAIMLWRAFRDGNQRWIYTTAGILILSLPYLGCMDMAGKNIHGNCMDFGIGILSMIWLAFIYLSRSKFVLETRSTVLLFYGVFAAAAVTLRLVIDGPQNAEILRDFPLGDALAPPMILVSLCLCAFFSRSLVPALIAAYVGVAVYIEMKPAIREIAEFFSWGSGLGSAITATVLVLSTFGIEKLKFLENLKGGDRFLGISNFPLIRRDHTLFTWPIIATALYLALKVDFYNGFISVVMGKAVLKTGIALVVSGIFWMILSVHLRAYAAACSASYFGWLCIFSGFFLYHYKSLGDHHWDVPVLAFFITLQISFWIFKGMGGLFEWMEKLFTDPARQILRGGSLLGTAVCIIAMMWGRPPSEIPILMFFLAALLIWHGCSTGMYIFGTVFFIWALTATVAFYAPEGSNFLVRAISIRSFTPLLYIFVTVQLLLAAMEFLPEVYKKIKSLLLPAVVMTVMLACNLMPCGFVEALNPDWTWTPMQRTLLLILLLLVSRATNTAIFALGAAFIIYALSLDPVPGTGFTKIFELLINPFNLSVFSLALAAAACAGRILYEKTPVLMSGFFNRPAKGNSGFDIFGSVWFIFFSVVFAFFSEGRHMVNAEFRNSELMTAVPYLGMLATLLCAWTGRVRNLYIAAGFLAVLGNIHVIHVFCGSALYEFGLTHMHIISIGLAISMIMFSALKFILNKEGPAFKLDLGALGCGALILCIIPLNYFASPDIGSMNPSRFVVSGILSLISALYFRYAARKPLIGKDQAVRIFEAVYHLGITIALWCMILLVPVMRTPQTALIALGIPTLYFLGCAEFARYRKLNLQRAYVDSATVMSFAIFTLYIFRISFQMIAFPDSKIDTDHYHYNSPVVAVIGLAMMRLHSLGAPSIISFFGGVAIMLGFFFGVTALPGLSPFSYQINSAWVAVLMAHFLTVATYSKSPLRNALQFIGGINDAGWRELRTTWGYCLAGAVQIMMLIALVKAYNSNTLMFAPLLAAGATILIHHGIIRKMPLYLAVAGIEILIAVHADFFTASYLKKDFVILVLLLLWALLLVLERIPGSRLTRSAAFFSSVLLMPLSMLHIMFHHHPWTAGGLWAFFFTFLMTASTPVVKGGRTGILLPVMGFFTAAAIPWLVYFGLAPVGEMGFRGYFETWTVLATIATVLVMASAIQHFSGKIIVFHDTLEKMNINVVFTATLGFWSGNAALIRSLALWILFPLTAGVQALHYASAFQVNEFIMYVILMICFAVLWYSEGISRKSKIAFWFSQGAAVVLFLAIRNHIMLTAGFWNCHYDIWVGLGGSFIIAAFKSILDKRSQEERIPAITTLCIMPFICMGWVLFKGLGVDAALLVLGLHSMIFAFLGKDDRQSPYNIAAVSGFLAFVLVVFWGKLHLAMFHAYVIPTGLGVMILLHLFRDRVRSDVRNQVRLATILIMLCSSAYYAFFDKSYTWVQIAVLGLLCIAAMILGSLMKIRTYLFVGFGGAVMTLAYAMVKAFTLYAVDRNVKMTIIGSSVFITGALLVGGAIFVRTHSSQIQEFIAKCRKIFGEWE
ncbi:MAG TPA: hypothetical protein DCZ94_02505 [Lentisphaeria bacterium]|nr:MAG: hypothetical protein A2X48_21725 [Lentisphaerae bacterium GWF2_49_21]HBC85806.1 hypothetical protein [Lentisphaeria bacterium]